MGMCGGPLQLGQGPRAEGEFWTEWGVASAGTRVFQLGVRPRCKYPPVTYPPAKVGGLKHIPFLTILVTH